MTPVCSFDEVADILVDTRHEARDQFEAFPLAANSGFVSLPNERLNDTQGRPTRNPPRLSLGTPLNLLM
jgi:hypothetical protein